MMHQIGLNHVFDDGTICFCLVCKDSITKNYPLDRERAICQHFISENHERSARNLFKICVPDPKCESRNIKYLDIVNNSEFEVWEQGCEPSYVSKKDNYFVCHVCCEEVSKVCVEPGQIKNNLLDHLGSESHMNNVKNGVWWTYHPSSDTNYIALNNVFMYCSFCQKILKSKENSLLEFAADHIETELKNTNLCGFSNTKLEEVNSSDDSINSSDNSETHLHMAITNKALETEPKETVSNDTSPQYIKDGSMLEDTQTITIQSIGDCKTFESSLANQVITVKAGDSEINLNQVRDVSKGAGKSVDNECIDSSQVSDIFNLAISKEEYVDCPKCLGKVEIFNGDVPFSILKHSQKHKDLSSIDNDIEFEIQEKADICHRCHKQIEILNKDTVMSYNRHIENCLPDKGNSLVSVENASTGCARVQQHWEESDIIAQAFSSLPNDLRDHLNYIILIDENLSCMVCNCKLYPSNGITTVCDILQNHFSEFYHKNLYAEYVQDSIDLLEDDQELEGNDHLLEGLQFSSSTINQTGSPGNLVKNNTLEQYNTEKPALKVPGGIVRTTLQVQEILNRLVISYFLVEENKDILDVKDGQFHCQLCDELLRCTRRGSQLIKHLNEDSHFSKFKNRTNKQIKVRARAKVLNILKSLHGRNKLIAQNIEDIGEKDGHFFCKRCDEVVICTRTGNKLVDHLNGLNHGLQMERLTEEQREVRQKARLPGHVNNILKHLASQKDEVSKSINVLGEKKGHFYCEICDEILECTWSGRKLVQHLRSEKHVFNLSNNLQ